MKVRETIIDVKTGQEQFIEREQTQEEVSIENKNLKIRKIQELLGKLASTDYQAIKFAEGALTEEEYAETKAQRQAWRDEINRLEKEIKQ